MTNDTLVTEINEAIDTLCELSRLAIEEWGPNHRVAVHIGREIVRLRNELRILQG